jgi:hypothetical protein
MSLEHLVRAIVLFLPASVAFAAAPATRPAPLAVGDLAADFELPRLTIETLDGKPTPKISDDKICLSSFRHKQPVLLILSSYT